MHMLSVREREKEKEDQSHKKKETHLLLVFPLSPESGFNALSCFNERFPLSFLTWPMCEYASQICAYQCHYCATDLKKK